MKFLFTIAVAVICSTTPLHSQITNASQSPQILPPAMTQRAIAKSATPPKGETITLNERETNFTLFIPKGWSAPTNGEVVLAIHFHSAPWFAIEEHLRRGLKGPLIAAQLGSGSSAYRKPFEDHERFSRLLSLVEKTLQEGGAPKNTKVASVDISSFSAGYGAVREILKSPEYFKLIRRIVLCDSIYAGFESETVHKPLRENIEPWLPFVKAATRGEKTFLLTHSQVETVTYATSGQCGEALIEAVGAKTEKILPKSNPSASDPDFPLLARSDLGNFHVWSYDGKDAQAHMTHLRHLADSWLVLDEMEKLLPAKNAK